MNPQDSFIRRGTSSVLSIEDASHDSFSVHWSAIFAGVFVAALTYVALMSLGLAIGAGELREVISGEESWRTVGAGGGVWMMASVLVSLFLGSYAAGRVSGIIATRVGYTQGAVITAMFFLVMLSQIGIGASLVGHGFSKGAAYAGTELSNNPRLNAMIEDALSDLNLRAPLGTVVSGVATRLIRGDSESAKTFLAAQAGVSRAEAQARIDAFSERFRRLMTDLGERSAQAASMLGWSAFVTMVLGSFAALLGGAAGALMNMRKPLGKADVHFLRKVIPGQTA